MDKITGQMSQEEFNNIPKLIKDNIVSFTVNEFGYKDVMVNLYDIRKGVDIRKEFKEHLDILWNL